MEFNLQSIITITLLILGCALMIVASIGVIRFPDLYTRMHAAGKADTLGQTLLLLSLIIYSGLSLTSIKLLFIMILFFVINPAATHFLAKSAYIRQVRPWTKDDKFTDREEQLL